MGFLYSLIISSVPFIIKIFVLQKMIISRIIKSYKFTAEVKANTYINTDLKLLYDDKYAIIENITCIKNITNNFNII
ncbi:hypothetical protein A966_04456 [Brachyspira hampsonii 30446]|uniref:Uncharacterized protein n=1 Tax=Brachyspira hampsonii 30446 TaxID=1289135 RepID=A0A2U4F2N2_9SPIR|nr:hypothetical protein A966_04456 [Brachyspira hampsonii 30446]